jgi:hypothetical protein
MPTRTASAGSPLCIVAARNTPSTVPPIRTASATASRFHAGTKHWIRINAGCDSNIAAAACLNSAAGVPQSRRESRICAVATTGELGSQMMTPPIDPSFHSANVRASRKRTL